ncbi:phenylalanine 4-monooxygenase [bacterium]|jgi:phenylalanine-4-hydroxylase|nr:phenylalanine 4-monooxygenase [bacterium]
MDKDFLVDLDQDHPGFRDSRYVLQRKKIAAIAEQYLDDRVAGKNPPIPVIAYTQHQHNLWKFLYTTILDLYKDHAVSDVYEGLRALELEADRIPTLEHVNMRLEPRTGWRVVPVSGLVSSKHFFSSLQQREFYCTQYIRHHSQPDFTPEPDICHDVIGHVPLLMAPKIAQPYVEFAKAAVQIEDKYIKRLENLYWFTVEYGLCYEDGILKTYGAGNLSSIADLKRCLNKDLLQHSEFDIETMCNTDYDPTIQQPRLFVAESLDFALKSLSEYFHENFDMTVEL